MKDKRNYRRFSLENSILLKFESDPTKVIEGELLDISFVGVSIFLKESVSVDLLVQTIVQFDFPSGIEQHLIGKGRIIHVEKQKLYAENGFRIGVEFLEVNKGVVLDIFNRLEAKIMDEIRKRSQIPRKNPDLF